MSREEQFAFYIIDNITTIRKCALVFGVSKSAVHNSVTTKLKKTNWGLYLRLRKVLEKNLRERHLRGGEATKNKYLKLKVLGAIQTK